MGEDNPNNQDSQEVCEIISDTLNLGGDNEEQIEIIANHDNQNKKKEDPYLCGIQNELNDLMEQLNNFISESDECIRVNCEMEDAYVNLEEPANECSDIDSEKKDGPSEKEFLFMDSFYINDGINPPEINWDVLAPFIQSTVTDLQKLRILNQKTSQLLEKMRQITEDKIESD